ncbi:MAG TPA: DUF1641 domain-containing protein [Thermoanaerobaculia bacterium]|nr:DUF1641 domain-containing protein [Thermoanaerobaculia bacterium]
MASTAPNLAALTPQERLQERLSEPQTLEALNRLLDRLDVIAFTAEALEGFLRRAEVVADSVAQGLADLRRLAGDETGGSEMLTRLPRMLSAAGRLAELMERPEVERLLSSGLLETLAEPRTLEALKALTGKLELVQFGLDAADGFLQRGDQLVDSLAAGARDLSEVTQDLDLGELRKVVDTLPSLVEAGKLLAEAGMFEPKTVSLLAQLGQSLAEAHREVVRSPRPPIGLFGLLRLIKDPEVQPILHWIIEVARRYSQVKA